MSPALFGDNFITGDYYFCFGLALSWLAIKKMSLNSGVIPVPLGSSLAALTLAIRS